MAAFNKAADTYDQQHGATCGVAHRLALAAVAAHGTVPRSVLDIGCGTGVLLDLVAQRWPQARLRGVDPAQRMIDVAGRRLPQAELAVATAERLPVPDASVDLVLSTTSFNHWSDHRAALREAARVARPGGLVVVVEHAPPGLLMGALLRLTGRMVRHHSPTDFARLAWAGGLHPLRVTREEGGFVRLLARPESAARPYPTTWAERIAFGARTAPPKETS
ncbi:class I SAM-dependent methyltransferase [Streptomyces sp. ISL-100]|uniref:class I SAM-dependent methyltransferase n=1 Tax=Streptomyces sp. ISL-100 TaxID=2819173 RepID=UPI001BE9C561|nr:class I SAM-dependent methyltransferase [Streptomyces sp. ISL-100]MBT2400812.1 class I SAM-dependent methyltransferase [Streptomyces sp. ISL-100]